MKTDVKENNIRNFCIIAHIDHGKSTLADRFIQLTGAKRESEIKEQSLDSMELERERGITIKAKAIRLSYKAQSDQTYELNLIDTPGHVDFSYEVSRTLAACEGAILVVDATQGIQAQTLANTYLAMEHNLEIIPVINKVDLPGAEPERVMNEITEVLGYNQKDIMLISAKTGLGVPALIEEIVKRVPAPTTNESIPFRALIFDSHYDSYKGVMAYLRVKDGVVKRGDKLRLIGHGSDMEAIEVGYFNPEPTQASSISSGEVGYIATGLKNVSEVRVGDTVTLKIGGSNQPITPYNPAKPMVFAGIYPTATDDFGKLREAIEKLSLNDASLSYIMEQSPLLGNGYRCGFLGLLHMDIVVERLEREFDLSLVVTTPGSVFKVTLKGKDQQSQEIANPAYWPDQSTIELAEEPWVRVSIITPSAFIGTLMEYIINLGGAYIRTDYMGHALVSGDLGERVDLVFEVPLRVMLTTFYDQIKSRTRGYASLDYEVLGYRPSNLVKLEILVNDVAVDAFARILPYDKTTEAGKALVDSLKKNIPRQLYQVPIQAVVGGKIVARADISAKRKDVIAKCYGGDITRKRKLLEKQKEGKKKMKQIGRVEVPREAFFEIMKID